MSYYIKSKGRNPVETNDLASGQYPLIRISGEARDRVLAHAIRTQQSMRESLSELVMLGSIASGVPSDIPTLGEMD